MPKYAILGTMTVEAQNMDEAILIIRTLLLSNKLEVSDSWEIED